MKIVWEGIIDNFASNVSSLLRYKLSVWLQTDYTDFALGYFKLLKLSQNNKFLSVVVSPNNRFVEICPALGPVTVLNR